MTATLDRRADYVSAVAVELADLPAEERAELIEELDDHVAALLEDRPDVDLVTELGTPRAYAAELRSAAGLQGSPAAAGSRRALRDLVLGVWARTVAALPWLPSFLQLLRPAWWVLRGGVVAAVVDLVLGFDLRSGEGIVLILLGVVASLYTAAHPRSTRSYRLLLTAVNVGSVLALTYLVLASPWARASQTYYDTQYVPNCPVELDNLYAYDASGKPLDGVRLYDQYGTPFDLGTFGCNVSGQFTPGPGGANAYPWPSYTYGQEVAPTGPPSSLAPLPDATVSSSGTPSGSPAGSPAASATPAVTPTPAGTS